MIDNCYIETSKLLDISKHEFKKLIGEQFKQTSNTISFLETI